jgi:hypothetical protein
MTRADTTANRILKRIGGRLREESRDIVEATLPSQVRALLERLSCVKPGDDLRGDPPRKRH